MLFLHQNGIEFPRQVSAHHILVVIRDICYSFLLDYKAFSAKDLIRKLLRTDPSERFTIEQTMNHKWIIHYQKVPETPLFTASVLEEEKSQWVEMQVSFYYFLLQGFNLFL